LKVLFVILKFTYFTLSLINSVYYNSV
jgi:hypothetical protein